MIAPLVGLADVLRVQVVCRHASGLPLPLLTLAQVLPCEFFGFSRAVWDPVGGEPGPGEQAFFSMSQSLDTLALNFTLAPEVQSQPRLWISICAMLRG